MSESPDRASWLEPGRTCWRKANASRAAFLMDNSTYFAAALSAVKKARKSILILGWGFDPRTRMRPDEAWVEGTTDEIGAVLKDMACGLPGLDVRVLIWKSALPISISQDFFPHRSKAWFEGAPVRFLLDSAVPFGACHHQKVLVIDDRLAFCGGGDISVDRWDSPAHLDKDPRRRMPNGIEHVPRHEVMMMVEGEVARAFGDMARERWLAATGNALPPPVVEDQDSRWPEAITPDVQNVDVGIARTLPLWRSQREVREIESLHLEAIRGARRTIYLENQYFTSPVITDALVRRLEEADGPEVVLVSTAKAPSYFDQATMDQTRSRLLARLQAADVHGRFRAFCPVTRDGKTIIVHSKVAIIDDDFLRIGSANLNNRSAGFDTECDVALEASDDAMRLSIARFRAQLLGHFTSFAPSVIEEITRESGLIAAIQTAETSDRTHFLKLHPVRMGPAASFIAAYSLGDPVDPLDAWRPFLRKRRLQKRLERLGRQASSPQTPIQAELDD